VFRTLRLLAVLFIASLVPMFAQPVITAVTSAVSFDANLCPGSFVAIFGANLAASERGAVAVPLPKDLGGTTVTFGGISAPLHYVSPTQVNAIIPFEVATGVVSIVVTTAAGSSAEYKLRLAGTAPAFFTRNNSGSGRAHVFDLAWKPVDAVRPGDKVHI
jgi:uncharacterized protein (TIGR03437 family)